MGATRLFSQPPCGRAPFRALPMPRALTHGLEASGARAPPRQVPKVPQVAEDSSEWSANAT